MVSEMDQFEFTTRDIELIEAALHTQAKILSVQSEAGGCGARKKLSELKRLSKRIGAARSRGKAGTPPTLAQLAMSLLHPQSSATS